MSELLTTQEKIVLEQMNEGNWLFKITGVGEGLSLTLTHIQNPVKKGTVERLLELGYITQTEIHNRYKLTQKGREFRQKPEPFFIEIKNQ